MATTATTDRNRTRGSPRSPTDDVDVQSRVVFALRDAATAAGNANVEVLETHISYVLLTGRFAYKIKKAVDLGFLDFTTLSRRRAFCHEEQRLNRRSAPSVYLDVVPITGTVDAPVIGGDGPPLEYAVKMREFPQEALASHTCSRHELSATHIDALATELAAFHLVADRAAPGAPFGAAEEICRFALQNFGRIRPLLTDPSDLVELDALRQWTLSEHAAIAHAIEARRLGGSVRECHGDLHLNNIALIDGRPTIFDCIEFDDALRWIDVINEVAFTVMDLQYRGQDSLAARFLNAYLEITGDYGGLEVLRFYLVYRALVRAMVVCERAHQLDAGQAQSAAMAEYRGYVALAKRLAQPPRPALIVTHGVSGCGKTTWSQRALEALGAIRIRTDVERKRLRGVDSRDHRHAEIDTDLYSAEATRETYRCALLTARGALASGWVTIVDGAFLMCWQRRMFRRLAAELDVPFIIVDLAADVSTVRRRIVRRSLDANDASDADFTVLDHQLRTREPLTAKDQADTVAIDGNESLEAIRTSTAWAHIAERIGSVRSAAVFATDRSATPTLII